MITGLTTKTQVKFLKQFIDNHNWANDYPHWLWKKELKIKEEDSNDDGDIALKWGGNLYNIFQVIKPTDVIVDLAPGDSPLMKILSPLCKRIMGAEMFQYQKRINANTNIVDYFRGRNIEIVIGDAVEHAASLENESIDIFYDCCSVIHFNPVPHGDKLYNEGYYQILANTQRALKPGGWYFTICDCATPKVQPDMFPHMAMVECIREFNKLKMVGDHDLSFKNDTFHHHNQTPHTINVVSFALQKI